jgi:hypothetical protein
MTFKAINEPSGLSGAALRAPKGGPEKADSEKGDSDRAKRSEAYGRQEPWVLCMQK